MKTVNFLSVPTALALLVASYFLFCGTIFFANFRIVALGEILLPSLTPQKFIKKS